MFTNKKGMVQVSGATYRIVQAGSVHEVFRLSDDRFIGSFRYAPKLALVECPIGAELLRSVARQALRSSCVAWEQKPAWSAWAVGAARELSASLLWWRASKPELARKLA